MVTRRVVLGGGGATPGWAPPTPPSRASCWPSGTVLCLPRNVGDFVCFPFTQPSASLASEDNPIETVCRSLSLYPEGHMNVG